MSGYNKQLLLIGFTLGFGALGFYVEEKVEAYYKVRALAKTLSYEHVSCPSPRCKNELSN
jgi:hypothetical protein